MYMDYSGLWKILEQRKITKTELSEITGISSRVIAKLSYGETVTTDTIARICEALNCRVADIMDCKKEDDLSFYDIYKRNLKQKELKYGFKIVRFRYMGADYTVFFTLKRASRTTLIHCKENGTVYWEQLYPFGGMSAPRREESVLIRPQTEGSEKIIIVINGKPGMITGLDEGIFLSSKRTSKCKDFVYVMSEAAFKHFQP